MARQEGLPWAGGSSALPPFASPANRALASQIDAMQTELDSVLALIREQTTREGRMTAYTERVRSENAEARKLVDARKTDVQVETERTREANMDGKRLERELYDLSQEIRQTEAQVGLSEKGVHILSFGLNDETIPSLDNAQISSFKTAVASGNNRSSRLEAAAIATLSELDDELQLQRLREEQDRVNEQEAQRIPKEAEAKVRRLERIENEIAMLEGRCLEEVNLELCRTHYHCLVSLLSFFFAVPGINLTNAPQQPRRPLFPSLKPSIPQIGARRTMAISSFGLDHCQLPRRSRRNPS